MSKVLRAHYRESWGLVCDLAVTGRNEEDILSRGRLGLSEYQTVKGIWVLRFFDKEDPIIHSEKGPMDYNYRI